MAGAETLHSWDLHWPSQRDWHQHHGPRQPGAGQPPLAAQCIHLQSQNIQGLSSSHKVWNVRFYNHLTVSVQSPSLYKQGKSVANDEMLSLLCYCITATVRFVKQYFAQLMGWNCIVWRNYLFIFVLVLISGLTLLKLVELIDVGCCCDTNVFDCPILFYHLIMSQKVCLDLIYEERLVRQTDNSQLTTSCWKIFKTFLFPPEAWNKYFVFLNTEPISLTVARLQLNIELSYLYPPEINQQSMINRRKQEKW